MENYRVSTLQHFFFFLFTSFILSKYVEATNISVTIQKATMNSSEINDIQNIDHIKKLYFSIFINERDCICQQMPTNGNNMADMDTFLLVTSVLESIFFERKYALVVIP